MSASPRELSCSKPPASAEVIDDRSSPMPGIDDPLEAARKQYSGEPTDKALELVMAAAGTLHPLYGVVSAIREFFSKKSAEDRVREMFDVLASEINRHGKQ